MPIKLTPLQEHFVNKVIKMAETDKKVKELFTTRAIGFTYALDVIDKIVDNNFKQKR